MNAHSIGGPGSTLPWSPRLPLLFSRSVPLDSLRHLLPSPRCHTAGFHRRRLAATPPGSITVASLPSHSILSSFSCREAGATPPAFYPPSTDSVLVSAAFHPPYSAVYCEFGSMDNENGSGEAVDMEIDRCEAEKGLVCQVPVGFSPNYLKVYYGKLFPYADICRWLSYGNDGKHPACDHSYFGRREFSFTLENDIYMRFQSFNSVTEIERAVKEKCPFKIDIGAVYSVDPAKRHAYAQGGNSVFSPIERELIFDIDMSDYDDIRYCCSGADVCLECWPLMTAAIKVLDSALRVDFGFNHILWVYSGRRGVHCWVCDGRARRLNNEQRSAVAEYLRVYKGGENNSKRVHLPGAVLHPFLVRSYTDVLRDLFEEKLLHTQQLFSSEERCRKILDLIPDNSIATDLLDKWQGNRRASISKEDINVVRWDQLKHTLQSGKQKAQGLRKCVEEIVFTYTYPRLDMEVSKHMNHLLKAPFCVHPKTGRVCVPIDPNNCDDFDPTTVPSLSELLEELNRSSIETEYEEEWERTSLAKPIRFFRSSFLNPLMKYCKDEMESAYKAKIEESKNSLNW